MSIPWDIAEESVKETIRQKEFQKDKEALRVLRKFPALFEEVAYEATIRTRVKLKKDFPMSKNSLDKLDKNSTIDEKQKYE